MGVVYAARQASIDRTVAIKMLKKEIAEIAEHRDKFLAEAVVTAELEHPNIVPIHDLGAGILPRMWRDSTISRLSLTWCEAKLRRCRPDPCR